MPNNSDQQWFYARDGRRVGPLTSRELRLAAEAGDVRQDDWVLLEGKGDWVAANKVHGLFPTPSPSSLSSMLEDVVLPPSWGLPSAAGPATTKACPFCAETILAEARKCKHCGEFLDDSQKKPGKAVFKASRDFIGLMCSYHVMDSKKRVLAKLKPGQSFETAVPTATVMYVWYSCGFAGAVQVKCRPHETSRFSISPSQMGMGCVVARVDVIDSD